MKAKTLLSLILILILFQCKNKPAGNESSNNERFNPKKDLLLVQYDCKTDVDDLHSIAAFATLMADPEFSSVKHHAVAGAYGIQEGPYVPPNDLFQLVFENNWSDAHNHFQSAVEEVTSLVKNTLSDQGDIWIADAGQSDFSANVVQAVQADLPDIKTSHRIHVVQHSDWNEEVTSPESLRFVKQHTDYHKIPDGNVVGNGTPGFRSPDYTNWKAELTDLELTKIWQLAVDIANKYNGKEGRYLNEAISEGGLDFSDTAEVCWILEIQDIKDTKQFFNSYTK